MKTSLAFVLSALASLAQGTVAQASPTNWVVYLQADSFDAAHSGLNGQIVLIGVLACAVLIGLVIGFLIGIRAGKRSVRT